MTYRITIQSCDGENFEVSLGVAKKSVLIATMLGTLGVEQDTDEIINEILPLPTIHAKVLRKVVNWCQHQHEQESKSANKFKTQEKTHPKITKLTGWERKFINSINSINSLGQSIMFDIIIAANYLDIQGLIALLTMEIARMMNGKTPKKIRDVFKIENDLMTKDNAAKQESSTKW